MAALTSLVRIQPSWETAHELIVSIDSAGDSGELRRLAMLSVLQLLSELISQYVKKGSLALVVNAQASRIEISLECKRVATTVVLRSEFSKGLKVIREKLKAI